jgi:iron(III) transport system substrate-binding protein
MLKTISAVFAFTTLLASSASAQQLTLYTAGPAGLAKSLSAGFEKSTGVKVNVFQATTGQIMARLTAERANPQADVLISASWDTAVDLKKAGQLLAYQSPNAKTVAPALKDSHYVAQGAAALAIVWNSKSGKPRPSDWADLAAPAYKDAVTIPDPSLSGAAFGMVSGIVAHKNYGWKLFESLRANGALVPGANAQALNPVLQGARAAVMGAVDYIAIEARAKGESVEIIYPSSGTVLEARPAMIMQSSKNAENAKRFIDYMLSEEGQSIVAGVYLLPARSDIAAKRAGWKEIKLFDERATSETERAQTLQQFKKIMGLK